MENLAEGVALPARVFAKLRHRDDVGLLLPKRLIVSRDARLLGAQAGEHGAATRIADRILHIGTLKGGATGAEPVEVRGPHGGLCESAAEVAEVVRHDEQDVGLPGGLRLARKSGDAEEDRKMMKRVHCGGLGV